MSVSINHVSWTPKCMENQTVCVYVDFLYRLAAEKRIADLQSLVDETFQQFALDDSEDDFDDGECPAAVEPVDTSLSYQRGSFPILSLPDWHELRKPLKTCSSTPTLTKLNSAIKLN